MLLALVICLGRLTINHASLSRWSTVPAPNKRHLPHLGAHYGFSVYYVGGGGGQEQAETKLEGVGPDRCALVKKHKLVHKPDTSERENDGEVRANASGRARTGRSIGSGRIGSDQVGSNRIGKHNLIAGGTGGLLMLSGWPAAMSRALRRRRESKRRRRRVLATYLPCRGSPTPVTRTGDRSEKKLLHWP